MRKIVAAFCLLLLAGGLTNLNAAEYSFKDLVIIGLQQNLGLQIGKISRLQAEQGSIIESSAFDSELFTSMGFAESVTPYEPVNAAPLEYESSTQQFQGGLKKRFSSGLTAVATLTSQRTEDDDLSNDLDPRYQTFLQLDLTQPLLRNYGRAANRNGVNVARKELEQAQFSYLLQAQHLIVQLETLLLDLNSSAEIVRLRQSALDLANKLYDSNEKRFRAGIIPITEIQEAETARADRELQLSIARQQRQQLQLSLDRLLDYALPGDFDPLQLVLDELPATCVPLVDSNTLLAQALEKRLDVKLDRLGVDIGRINADYQKNQLKPQLDLTLSLGLNGLSGSDRGVLPGSIYAGDWSDSFSSAAEADGYQWGGSPDLFRPTRQSRCQSQVPAGQVEPAPAAARSQGSRTTDSLRTGAAESRAVAFSRTDVAGGDI